MDPKTVLYQKLFSAYKNCHHEKKPANCQREVNQIWNDLKSKYKNSKEFFEAVESKIKELNEILNKKKASVTYFFSKTTTTKNNSSQPSNQTDLIVSSSSTESSTRAERSDNESSSNNVDSTSDKGREKPAQQRIEEKINILEKELNVLLTARNTFYDEGIDKQIKKKEKELKTEKKNLKRKKKNAFYQDQNRKKKKKAIEKVISEYPEAENILKIREDPGRPKIEEEQPALHQAIIDIAIFGSGADDRRRSEMIRSVKTLDDLHAELLKNGFSLSRSATYLRLIPRNVKSHEGKRHVSTVPVKLVRAEGDLHKKHVDGEFATGSIRYLECLASILGPASVFFLSQDDKARIPIGITAANKQSPLLMHMQYKISLPDHDWVVADRHKLIPSVYAGIKILPGHLGKPEATTYSGPTYVAIRSGKHTSSTALTHAQDFETVLNLENFRDFAKTSKGLVKPVAIITVDGGPDENPRYNKVIRNAIRHFKNFNLDAMFIATNAPGRSAYNRVERRMAPLSHELAGLVLPHDFFGNHLDEKGATVDPELEMRNFEFAGKALGEVWSKLVIDDFPVSAAYIPPVQETNELEEINYEWHANHVRESQYLLQIVKCDNQECCSPTRSSLKKVLPDRFLPPPLKIIQDEDGMLKIVDSDCPNVKFLDLLARLTIKIEPENMGFSVMPYDYYCPSVNSALADRTCQKCGIYFSSKKSNANHVKAIHKKENININLGNLRPVRVAAKRARELMCIWKDSLTGVETADWISEDEIDPKFSEIDSTSAIYQPVVLIERLEDWLLSPWDKDTN